jgi:transcriptional regulator with XRE-family HTH domain
VVRVFSLKMWYKNANEHADATPSQTGPTLKQNHSQATRSAAIRWVTHVLETKRWRGTDLARRAGLAPSTVLRLLNDPTHQFVPSLRTLQKVSAASGLPIPQKIISTLGATESPEVGPFTAKAAIDEPGSKLGGAAVPLSSVSGLPATWRGQTTGSLFVPRPAQLEGDETVCAFRMPDGSLEPWIRSGDLLYVTRRREPIVGDLVLVTDVQDRSRVRLLSEIDHSALRLRTAQSSDEEQMLFTDVKTISAVAVIVRA